MSMTKNQVLSAAAAAVLGFSGAADVSAAPTDVQFSTTENGVYNIFQINQFDWSSGAGSLVVSDVLPSLTIAGTGAGAVTCATFACWAANSVAGQSVTYNIYSQTVLANFISPLGGAIITGAAANLNSTGTGSGFEITAALTGVETAVRDAFGGLIFTAASGSYRFYFDSTPDFVLATGAGFINGINFLSGTFMLDPTKLNGFVGTGGSTFLNNTIDAYNPLYIQADPLSNSPLTGSTFATTLQLGTGLAIATGGTIGLPTQYTVAGPDIKLLADSNTQFSSSPVPEPGTVLLVGAALLGLGWSTRRSRS